MKIDVDYLRFMWPMRHFLITTGDTAGAMNIITVSFSMPVSKEPPLIACAIGAHTLSYELLRQTPSFVVNVPSPALHTAIYYCGFHSGREVDKFKETHLTPGKARTVSAPTIEECIAHMECIVTQEVITGDKMLIVGKVVEAYADSSIATSEAPYSYALGDFPKHIYATRFK